MDTDLHYADQAISWSSQTLADLVELAWDNVDQFDFLLCSMFSLFLVPLRTTTANSPEEIQKEIIDQMVTMYTRKIPFRPFAIEKVQWAAATCPITLTSGFPQQLIDIVTQSPEMQNCFKVILSVDEIDVGKPDPALYLETAKRLGVVPEKCLCLNDSPFGVLSGRRANMVVVNVPDPNFPLLPEQAKYADLILESLKDLSKHVIAKLDRGVDRV
jgi:HAD superfamily hydrolase (TIGR01509 family)